MTSNLQHPANAQPCVDELLALVPVSAARVLLVECEESTIPARLRNRGTTTLIALSRNCNSGPGLRATVDALVEADPESMVSGFAEDSFDAVVWCRDFSRVSDPLPLLKRIRRWLRASGVIVCPFPNMQHLGRIEKLMGGSFERPSNADLRFYTRREIEKLLYRAGFCLTELIPIAGPTAAGETEGEGRSTIRLGPLEIGGLAPQDEDDFQAERFVARAMPSRRNSMLQDDSSDASVIEASDRSPDSAIERLKKLNPWPSTVPDMDMTSVVPGWFADGAQESLSNVLSPETRVVVELGAWLGMSTRYIADHAPNATIVTIDHWEGSPEHKRDPELSAVLPHLYEMFLHANRAYRDRMIPIRGTTQDGLRIVAESGLQPDVIFFDADHNYDAVRSDLALALKLFPGARLIGDDFDAPDVMLAVCDAAYRVNRSVRTAGRNWRAWELSEAANSVPVLDIEAASLTSIILVTHNELGYTRQCINSLLQFTDEPYELIVVDNQSTDGTVEYLKSLDGARLIFNDTNRGFPAAVNQGIGIAGGDQVLLLNNDTIVTTSWLTRLLSALSSDETIGLVGPCSNNVSGEQCIPVDYEGLSAVDGFAWEWGKRHHGQLVETDRLVGFCLLIKRDVIDRVGLLDEQFGIGCFEDDDYCRRATAGDYRCVIARDAFVHHFGSRTFAGSGVDFAEVMATNQARFDRKWAAKTTPTDSAEPQGRAGGLRIIRSADNGFRLVESDVRLSLCMIVRDNEKTIEPCLASIQPWVDEIIVVDTGSQDTTPDICRRYGAILQHFPWCDDFSAARNESLKYASGEWIFWMDSDDTIEAEQGQKLRELADRSHDPNTLGFVMQVHCPGVSDTGAHEWTIVDHVKLFRNRPDLRFEHRIHEQILPAIRRAGGEVEFTDIFVVHSGTDHSEEMRARKLERDFRILELDLQERPDHPFILFNLGMTYEDAGRYDQAESYLRRCLEVSANEESHVRKTYALLANSLREQDRAREAIESTSRALELFPGDKELLFRRATLQQDVGQLEEAARDYHRVISDDVDRAFLSVDPNLRGYKAHHNLALVYQDLGRIDEALDQWRAATDGEPGFTPAWLGSARLLISHRRVDDARALQTMMPSSDIKETIGNWIEALCCEATGDYARAEELLERCYEQSGQFDCLDDLGRLLTQTQSPAAALPVMERLADLQPDNPSVLHNLGVSLAAAGRVPEAVASLQNSLGLREDSVITWLQLARVHADAGDTGEAVRAYAEVLARDPTNPEATQAHAKLSSANSVS